MADEKINQFYIDFQARFEVAVQEMGKRNPALAAKMKARKYSLFNQDPRASLKPGKYYFIGINPGGGDEYEYPDENQEFWNSRKLGYSGFFDEFWKSEENKSYSTLQRQSQRLLIHLAGSEEKARQVFSTNRYFYRTQNTETLAQYPAELIDCWDFHRKFLDIVKPRVVLCNGNSDFSAFSVFRDNSISGTSNPVIYARAGKGYVWGFKSEGKIILGMPHLSFPAPGIENIIPALDEVIEKLK